MSHAAGIQSQVFHVGRAVLSLEYAHIHLGLRLDLEAEMVEVFPTHLYACLRAKSLQSCPTLCNPMDCSPPGSSFHGIFLARILEWVGISFSRGSFQPKDRTLVSCVSCIADSLPTGPPGKPVYTYTCCIFICTYAYVVCVYMFIWLLLVLFPWRPLTQVPHVQCLPLAPLDPFSSHLHPTPLPGWLIWIRVSTIVFRVLEPWEAPTGN